MGSFNIIIKPSAERELRKLPKHILSEVSKLFSEFAEHPYPRRVEKLSGGEELYRIRVGEYRVVYNIDLKIRVITIYRVRHRKDVYRKF